MKKQTFLAKIKNGNIEFYDKTGSTIFIELMDGKEVDIAIEAVSKKRTMQQNSAIHLFCEMLAQELNDAGLDMREVIKPGVDIDWSMESVKEYLWRPIQKALLKKESTTQLTTDEVSRVYETLTRHLGSKFGVFVEFPSENHPAYQ